MQPIKVEVKAHLMVLVTVKIHMSIENALTYNKKYFNSGIYRFYWSIHLTSDFMLL